MSINGDINDISKTFESFRVKLIPLAKLLPEKLCLTAENTFI